MYGVIRNALTVVSNEGAPRHPGIVVTLNPHAAGVVMDDHLKSRHSNEMVIILENWFDRLQAEDKGFWVTLNFENAPERLYLPYSCINRFFDKAARFGFEASPHVLDASEPQARNPETSSWLPDKAGKVVSLDSFRKK